MMRDQAPQIFFPRTATADIQPNPHLGIRCTPNEKLWCIVIVTHSHTCSCGGGVTTCIGAASLAHRLNTEMVELLQLFHRSVGVPGGKQSLSKDTQRIV